MIKNTKKDSEKKHAKDIKIFLKKNKIKGKKRLKKDIKILLQKRKKKYISIFWSIKRSYSIIEEVVI